MKSLKYIQFLFFLFFIIIIGNKTVEAKSIPRVYIGGDLSMMNSKKDVRKVTLRYRSDTLSFNTFAQIKIQGNSSLNFEKKNYTIQLYQDASYEKEQKVDVGFGKQSKYCLKANWIDFTHARNIVTARIAAQIQKKYQLFEDTPNYGLIDGFPIEVYLNEEFLGIYTWNIPKSRWMFHADENNSDFLLLTGKEGSTFDKRVSWKQSPWEVDEGEETEESLKNLNRLFNFINESSLEEFKKKLSNYMNLDALINYYILFEFAYLYDNLTKNMILVTYDGKVWYPSLYDLDTSFGTDYAGENVVEDYKVPIMNSGILENFSLYKKLLTGYPNEVADRYFILRQDILTKENIMNSFQDFENEIPSDSFTKEQERWGDIPGYGLDQIEEFLNQRIPYLDLYFSNLYTKKQEVSIQYHKNKDGTITATLIPTREDLIVVNNEGKRTYTFKKPGTFLFEYQNLSGEKNTITARVKNLSRIPILELVSGIALIIGSIGISYFILRRKKKKQQDDSIEKKRFLAKRRHRNIKLKK